MIETSVIQELLAIDEARMYESPASTKRVINDAITALATAQTEAVELRAEVATVKSTALAFIVVWAIHYARLQGYPPLHLHPVHFDLIAAFGGDTARFARAALTGGTPHEPA